MFEAFGMDRNTGNSVWMTHYLRMNPVDLPAEEKIRQKTVESGSVRLEARLWFYYRATRYIDCGYEALHMGQVHLYTANDKGMVKTAELFGMIRAYAAVHARRHKVLLDAHTHGVNIRGKLLFDYHAMPFTRMPLLEVPGEELVLVREGYSEGGENPNGWSAKTMPYLMEYDNWGGLVVDDRENIPGRAGVERLVGI